MGQGDVGFIDAADPRMQHMDPDFLGRQIFQRPYDGLDRTVHVGLDDRRQRLEFVALLDFLEHLLEGPAGTGRRLGVTVPALAEIDDLAGPGFAFNNRNVVAGGRRAVQSQDLDRYRRTGFVKGIAMGVKQGADPAPLATGDENIADFQGAALNQNRRHRTAAWFQLGFDDDAFRLAIGVGLEVQQLRLQQDNLFQLVQVGLFLG